jgi:hypothetical protein
VGRSRTQQTERTLGMASRFLEEVREDIRRAAQEGGDIAPRIRSVHERAGHATPEFRTVAIPLPDEMSAMPPEVLSGTIAQYARRRTPDCLLLAMEAEMQDDGGDTRSLLIAEARDRAGTRMYWMQPFRPSGAAVDWDEPVEGGWRDPGEGEMILDAAFAGRDLPPEPPRRRRRPRRPAREAVPAADREVALQGAAAGRAD